MAPSSWREGLRELGGWWQEQVFSDPMELYETSPYFYQEPHFYDGENYLPVHLQGFEPPGYERTELSLSPEARGPLEDKVLGPPEHCPGQCLPWACKVCKRKSVSVDRLLLASAYPTLGWMLGEALKQGFWGQTEAWKELIVKILEERVGQAGGLQPVAHPPTPPQVPSECSSHSASCSPEWGSALEFGPNPGDHLLTADPTDAHNLHSLTSIVDSITVEDVSVAFPDETMPN
uniref:Myogenin n=1 Tax=Camelus bactrianus TaxID=9837 RepID=A0A9W3FT84_CAMBA|nr:myogenin [Camelus bactrianus]